ncbi:LuxR C-terminal-related transcriptional regulator [Micromonospora sp. KC207]|uniref:LuxR C-terminal-related transcriptional regulator n=1 Tax=Micromonospora sp. KC207 TaxID=2530377 RepID=UPI001404C6EE|nr:LuxR C-terminal-related transcriptional regulator [Micromonospora sp. KC207]
MELIDGFLADAAAGDALVLHTTAAAGDRPLAVIGRLLRSAARVSPRAAGMARLLGEGILSATPADLYQDNTRDSAAQLLHNLRRIFLDLTEDRPVFIRIGAAQHIDPVSRQCLLGLARRLAATRLMLVLAEDGTLDTATAAELLALPHCQHVRLASLSLARVADLIGARLDDRQAWNRAAAYHATTGGNRLLLYALLADEQHPAAGQRQTFTRAVQTVFGRLSESARTVGLALAVLDPFSEPALLPTILGLDAVETRAALAVLADTGLIDAGRFRDPVARETILADTTADARSPLHLRAAEALRGAGAPPRTVARHLVAASDVTHPWAAGLLIEAAGQALHDGAPQEALAQLRCAGRATTDETQRATVIALLAHAEWWTRPEAARRHLDTLVDALANGRLRDRPAVLAVRHLFWYGRTAEAVAALDRLALTARPNPAVQQALNEAGTWLGFMAPAQTRRLTERATVRPGAGLRTRGAQTLAVALRQPGDEALALVERLLQRALLDPRMVEPVLPALAALLHLDEPDRALTWCDVLGTRSGLAEAPMWQAILDSIRAQAALRLGDLPTAERRAQSALARIPAVGWGVAIGAPRATLIHAMIEMGRVGQAADILEQPFPSAMTETSFGLCLLQTRGWLRLAQARPREALDDFRTAGDELARGGVQTPSLWPVGAARALLQLGETRPARELLESQISAGRALSARVRGAALRTLAQTANRRKQVPILSEAIQVLQASGDKLELAHALADLSETYYAMGESNRARMTARRAHHLARVCRAEPLIAKLRPSRTEPVDAAPEGAGNVLSEAEQRVAVLAAHGYSNREIAHKLFITSSTVEQHLTRIYRKLQVSGRSSLPAWLQLDAAKQS